MDAFVYRFTRAKRIANTSNTTRRDAQAYCSDAGHAISRRLIFSCALALCALTARAADRNWSVYLGDKGTSHYSTLKQLTPKNVRQLEVAWTYHSKDGRSDNLSQIQCNPLVIDGVLYGTTPALKLIALDAATGEQRWQFDPAAGGAPIAVGVNRGVVFWSEGNDRRILYGADHFLYCINADTGKPIRDFGTDGRVDVKDGLGRDVSKLFVTTTSPGSVYKNLFFLPIRVGEGPAPAAPGHLRAYDVRTGKIVWTFHTIPYPGEEGYETWPPDAYKYIGGVNCWPGMAVDEQRGIVFAPIGSAAFDFWGGDRIGDDLFANCLLALDANTGKKLWHFQTVHHDLLDRDPPSAPVLLTVTHQGKRIDAVAQTTKSGFVFLFERQTGKPLFDIQEISVPQSDLQGESSSPRQPMPVKPAPFARQLFTYNEITDISPESHHHVLERFSRLRPHVPFCPPSTNGTIIFPGFDGGGEWGGAAADPDGVLYVNGNEMPWVLTMVPVQRDAHGPGGTGKPLYSQVCAPCHGIERQGNKAQNVPPLLEISKKLPREDIVKIITTGKGVMPSFAFLSEAQKGALADLLVGTNTATAEIVAREEVTSAASGLGEGPYTITGYNRWLDTNGFPAVKPPWGTLNAIDLNTGEYRWRVPLGEIPALTAKGIPKTGLENYGGPVVTAGGLIFIGATKDEMFRAFDRKTGDMLWETKLPAGGYATPATYEVNGRQYVVIACGGGKMGTKSGDAYVAFALKENGKR